MSVYSSVLGVTVLLLHLWETYSFPTFQACPVPCLCQRGPLLNCSSLGLTRTPIHIPATAVSLNISHNALHSLAPLSSGHVKLKGLLHLWVGSNSLQSLSLVLKNNGSGTRTLSSGEQECMSWAPDLQLLSAERNHLQHLPRGLGCINSLQILHLSYNQISEIGRVDLNNSTSLKELHLQHNQIRNIHSRAFIDLQMLQVLDLSYNLLATIPVPAYQSLWNLNALVNVSFNKWRCDCNLQTLRRWIGFKTEIDHDSWQMVCDSPSHHAGKDLLHLKDADLTCPTHEYSTSGHYHNMIVDEGMQILISCRNESQDFMQVQWWTPHGQVKDNQPELLIKNITQQHKGLYICVSRNNREHISVFNLEVYVNDSGPRPRREAPTILHEHAGKETKKVQRNNHLVRQITKTQSEFVLAVCLSVIITFILAFILGVLLRPVLDKLWRRIRSKRPSTPSPITSRASSTGPQLYVNEGYSDAGDQEQDVRVGSRVTFGGVTEVGNQSSSVPYYVTAENVNSDGSSESNTEVETAYEKRLKQTKTSSEKRQKVHEVDNYREMASNSRSVAEGEVNAVVTNNQTLAPSSNKVMEFEPIPDADNIMQLRSSSSSSSSSHTRQTLDRNVLSKVVESVEQSVDPPADTVFVNETTTKGKIPGFTTEQFAEWSTSLTDQDVDDLDTELWNDSGESFSFNEGSEKSSIQDHSNSALGHLINDNDTWRQGNIESPSNKLNFNSHALVDKRFGKEVPVDDVKIHKFSDTVSSYSLSESDSEGPNSYTVNPEIQEESEILHESYRKTDPDKFHTLIKQETITLDPSDIHLTFTREESVDEDMLTVDPQRTSEDVFGIIVGVSLDTWPKVKRYIQFTQSNPHSSTLSWSLSPTPINVTPKMELKSEVKTDTSPLKASYLTQIKVSPDKVPKVKRYIHFKQSEPQFKLKQTDPPNLPPSPSSTKDTIVEAKRYSTSSEDEAKVTSEGDKYFRKIGVSFNGVPKVKRYIKFKQTEPSSPTFSVSSPSIKIEATSTSSAFSTKKDISGKIPQYKKQFYSSNFTPEGLPLYHVHPVYSTSQNRLNRDIDRSSSENSSEDEDQFTAYPRKLEIKIEPENNTDSITSDKKVLNIDFDNSSSSTDVFEKKHNKGLTRLKVLRSRLFNRREHETDERNVQTGSITTLDLSYKCHSKSAVDTVQQTTSEDSFFGHIGLSFDQLKRHRKSLLFTTSDPKSPNQLSSVHSNDRENTHMEKAEYESRRFRHSSSSEGSFNSKHEGDIIIGQSLFLDELPKVKRYLQFSHSGPYSQAKLPCSPTTGVVTPAVITTTVSRKSSSSSEDDVTQSTEGENFYGLPKLKRYIQFSPTEPFSTTQHLNKQSISPTAPPESRRSSSSSDDDSKPTSKEHNFFETIGVSLGTVPKVERYIKFNQPESYSPTLSSSPVSTKKLVALVETSSSTPILLNVKSDPKGDNYFGQTGVCLDTVPKVKRYVQFTQSKTHSSTLSSLSSSSTKKNVTPETEMKSEAEVHTSLREASYLTEAKESPERIPKVKRYIHFKHSKPHSPTLSPSLSSSSKDVRVKRSSTSSEDEAKLTTEKDNLFRKVDLFFDGISKVKRYITFKQFKPTTPTLYPVSSPSTKTKATTVAGKKSMQSSSSSEDDVSPTSKENELFGEKGVSLDKLPQVKRYLQFKQHASHLPVVSPTTSLNTLHVTPATKTKLELRKLSTSSEGDLILTAQEDKFFKQTGASFDRIPKVKRYIYFTQPESQSSTQLPADQSSTQSTAAQSVNISGVVHETRRLSTLSEEDVKRSTYDNKMNIGTGESLIKIPKVKRYIKFTQSKYFLGLSPIPVKSINVTGTGLSSSSEGSFNSKHEVDIILGLGLVLDELPKVKRYLQFSHSGPHSQVKLPSSPATTGVVIPALITTTVSRKSSSSSEDDVTQSTEGENFYGLPKLKRYIQFSPTEPFPTTQHLNKQSISPTAPPESRRSSSSSDDDIKPTSKEHNFFETIGVSLGTVPKVKRYIKFNQPDSYSPTLSSSPVSTKKLVALVETSSSTPILLNVKSDPKGDNYFGQTGVCLDTVPKVKRYVQFTQSKTHSSTLSSLSSSSTKKNVTSETEMKSEAEVHTSLREASYLTEAKESPERIPKVKRYIHFKHSEPHSPTLSPSLFSSSKYVRVKRSNTSSEDEAKLTNEEDNLFRKDLFSDGISRVKRYITFKQFKPTTPTLYPVSSPSTKTKATTVAGMKSMQSSSSSEDDVSPTSKENELFGEKGVSLDKLPQAKRYLQFKQHASHLPVVSPTTSLNTLHVTPDTKTKLELRKLSTSSEGDLILTAQEDKFFKQKGASFDRIPKVTRYIYFTQPESQSSTKSTADQSSIQSTAAQSVNISGVVHETRRLSTSSEEDVKRSTNDNKMNTGTGESLIKIPKVKRYIKFTQSKHFLGLSPIPVKSINVTETTLRGSSTLADKVQAATNQNKTDSRRQSTSSEDDVTLHAKETGASLDRIPKVNRYIYFTQKERQFPAQSTTADSAQRISISDVVQETRKSRTSNEENVKPYTDYDYNVYRQTRAFFSQLPKVKRYIKFKHESSAMEDNVKLNRFSYHTSVKSDSTPKAKAEMEKAWSNLSSDASSTISMIKGSAVVIRTESESLRSKFSYKDNILTRKSTDGLVEQTGLKPELSKSSYMSSDNRDLVGHVVMGEPPPQNESQAVLQTPPPPLEQEDAREYLRDNSQIRQRLERRRLLQQRRKAMDDFTITSLSSSTQEGNMQNSSSMVDNGGANSNASVLNTAASRRIEIAEGVSLQGLKTKSISALRSKSQADSADTEYKEFLI